MFVNYMNKNKYYVYRYILFNIIYILYLMLIDYFFQEFVKLIRYILDYYFLCVMLNFVRKYRKWLFN